VYEHDRDEAFGIAPNRVRRHEQDETHDSTTEQSRTLQSLAAARSGHPLDHRAALHLQRMAGNAGVSSLVGEEDRSPVHDVVGRGGGQALDRGTREFMESRLGADFGDVRVHTDSQATASARSVQAHAYTVGNDVVFQGDRYQPGTDSGRRMLAHELTHVVQQRSGPVDGTAAPGGIKLSDPSDRFERQAESTADAVVSGSPTPATAAAGPAAGVQRDEDTGEEPTAQTLSLQRAEAEEDEKEQEEGA